MKDTFLGLLLVALAGIVTLGATYSLWLCYLLLQIAYPLPNIPWLPFSAIVNVVSIILVVKLIANSKGTSESSPGKKATQLLNLINVKMTNNEKLNEGFTVLFSGVATNHKKLKSSLKSLLQGKHEIVYIAGKVTGLKYADVKLKFANRAKELIEKGYIVINPCDFISPDEDWCTAMAICLQLLPLANRISLLPDWQDSEGATMEKYTADKYGITVI